MQICLMSHDVEFVLVLMCILNVVFAKGISTLTGDICQNLDGRRILIKPGELQEIKFEKLEKLSELNNSESLPQICKLQLETRYDSHFVVTFLDTNLPRCSNFSICGCDYISVRQPEYKKTYIEYCGTHSSYSSSYESKTKVIAVDFVYKSPRRGIFSVQIRALRNMYTIRGHHEQYNLNSTGYLESPYFPSIYPSEYSAEYVLINDDSNGFVQLVFTDFQLSHSSDVLVIYDTNGSEIGRYSGSTVRPPVIYSTGRNLTLNFTANSGYPSLGFRAYYKFMSYVERYLPRKLNTDCGGVFVNSGGVIILGSVTDESVPQFYDCIWIIRPSLAHGSNLYIKVTHFNNVGSHTSLRIHEGLTSKSLLVATIKKSESPSSSTLQTREHIVPLPSGLYIRFLGYLNNKSHIEMIYTAFKFDTCISSKNYQCANGRCIDTALCCDGFDNCGDGSDEKLCISFEATALPEDGTWWRTLTPNYYFPKQDSAGTGTNTLILITSLAGLGMFIITTTLILFKLHKQRREDSNLHQALNTISQEVDAHSHSFPPNEPPLYDPPPSYDDVIKFYLAPPPTYTSVTSSDSDHSSGIENAAFVPDVELPCPNIIQPPSLLTLILLPPNLRKSNSSASDKQAAPNSLRSSENGGESPGNNMLMIAEDNTSDKDFVEASDSSRVDYVQRVNIEKDCSCEGACSCRVSESANKMVEDNHVETLLSSTNTSPLPEECLSTEEECLLRAETPEEISPVTGISSHS